MLKKAENETKSSQSVRNRARAIATAGGLVDALSSGSLPAVLEISMSEALVLALLRQDVSKYFAIFGHGSTDLGEVLRVYEEEGVTRTVNCRNEVEMAHAATCLSWQYGEVSAVVTSIGPGALQAMAGSLAAASNGVGVYHIYGDETTFGEGYNMQQVPKEEQGLFGQITARMGQSYVLHTPEALRDAMRRGTLCVHHPYKAGPFYLLLPLNTQPQTTTVNLEALPEEPCTPKMVTAEPEVFEEAAELLNHQYARVVLKAGGGCCGHDGAIARLAEATGAAVVQSPVSTGVLPDSHPQNMHVGGSKGSISGNFAMENADLLIAVGTRAVCQSDCSGIGYPNVKAVININGDLADLNHYANTIGLAGDIGVVIDRLLQAIASDGDKTPDGRTDWLAQCQAKKEEWSAFKAERFAAPPLHDEAWGEPVLTQPAAIKIVADFAKSIDAAKYFDAGDVQANGFQIVEDDSTGDTFTEAGASYMGFSVSALLASAIADSPRYGIAFTGDGSFMMNPQILIDGVEHGTRGMIVIFDNRRMAAITGLQEAQYRKGFKTSDSVAVDYVQMAASVSGVNARFGGTSKQELEAALRDAHDEDGLSVVHVPVYCGSDPLGGMGAYGSWNVGNWCEDVQETWLRQNV